MQAEHQLFVQTNENKSDLNTTYLSLPITENRALSESITNNTPANSSGVILKL